MNAEINFLEKEKILKIESKDERIEMMIGHLNIEIHFIEEKEKKSFKKRKHRVENENEKLSKKIQIYTKLAQEGNELAEIYLAESYLYGRGKFNKGIFFHFNLIYFPQKKNEFLFDVKKILGNRSNFMKKVHQGET